MTTAIDQSIRTIQAIDAVPHIMKLLADTTGLRFICVARVTQESWTLCARLDEAGYDLNPGDQLDIETTFCDRVRAFNTPVVIDNASNDEVFKTSPIPGMYGFESYFSFPIYDAEGAFFGTLCGLDPLPVNLKNEKTMALIKSFSELITRQIVSEDRLSLAESTLSDEQDGAKLREQYIAILGHDLRTPLSSIMMGIDALKESTDHGLTQKLLGRMETSSKRMSRLISDAMDFTYGKVGNGIPLSLKPVDNLKTFLRDTVAELSSLHPEHDIVSNIDMTGRIICDPARIAQLLSNLLINAIVHGDSGQPVEVNATMREARLTLSVSNTGTPISQETKDKLFKPFWRNAHKKNTKGLGLGLFIASQIARAHDGDLAVTSSGSRTTFTFTATLQPL